MVKLLVAFPVQLPNITNPSYVANQPGEAGKSSDYNKNSTIKNFEVSKETKDIAYAPGQIERLTVAVAVNKVLTSVEESKIEELVKTAAGADMARGDIITVTGMSFAGIDEIEAKQAALAEEAKWDNLYSAASFWGPYALIIIFGGGALLIFWSLIRQTYTGC